MADPQRYVVVDKRDPRVIIGGPYMWDGQTEWTPPVDGILMLEEKYIKDTEGE